MSDEAKAITSIQQRIVEAAATLYEEGEGNLAYQHGLMCQVGLPRSRQPERTFERTYKNASLLIEAGRLWDGQSWLPQPLPYGAKPRIALLYINSEAVKKESTLIDIGGSYKEFCRRLSLSTEGKTFYDLKRQMMALAAARLTLGFNYNGRASTLAVQPIERFDAWLVPDGAQMNLWPAELRLSKQYLESLLMHAVPLPMTAVAALTHSALCLDQITWLSRRLPSLEEPVRVPYVALKEQFGQEYKTVKDFRKEFLIALRQVLTVYSGAKIEEVTGGLLLKPSRPLVSKTIIQGHSLTREQPKALSGYSPSATLTERTIERFRAECPRLDVYACKADFDTFLAGPKAELPKNYQSAFLGFAKKWKSGKG